MSAAEKIDDVLDEIMDVLNDFVITNDKLKGNSKLKDDQILIATKNKCFLLSKVKEKPEVDDKHESDKKEDEVKDDAKTSGKYVFLGKVVEKEEFSVSVNLDGKEDGTIQFFCPNVKLKKGDRVTIEVTKNG